MEGDEVSKVDLQKAIGIFAGMQFRRFSMHSGVIAGPPYRQSDNSGLNNYMINGIRISNLHGRYVFPYINLEGT